jgi:hypothetical protein
MCNSPQPIAGNAKSRLRTFAATSGLSAEKYISEERDQSGTATPRVVDPAEQPAPGAVLPAAVSWHHLWRRRFPRVVWRQIRGELLGHLTLAGYPS